MIFVLQKIDTLILRHYHSKYPKLCNYDRKVRLRRVAESRTEMCRFFSVVFFVLYFASKWWVAAGIFLLIYLHAYYVRAVIWDNRMRTFAKQEAKKDEFVQMRVRIGVTVAYLFYFLVCITFYIHIFSTIDRHPSYTVINTVFDSLFVLLVFAIPYYFIVSPQYIGTAILLEYDEQLEC